METVIKRRKRDFSQIQNDRIVSKDLSDAAFRLICYIEMQADTWKFYKEEIKKRFWWWEDKYTLSMQALKKNWYISHYPVKNAQWKIDNWVIELTYETQPVGVKTTPWIDQGVDEPAHGKPPQYNNTNENNTKYNNKKEIIVSKDTTPDGEVTDHFVRDTKHIVPSSWVVNTPPVPPAPPAVYVPKEITVEINKIIDTVKNSCKTAWIVYSSDSKERMYAKHLTSNKFKSECLDQLGMDLYEFLEKIVILSSQVKFSKVLSSAKLVYYNRWDVINKAKQQQQTIQSTQKRVFKY
jgi:hypothetical protein